MKKISLIRGIVATLTLATVSGITSPTIMAYAENTGKIENSYTIEDGNIHLNLDDEKMNVFVELMNAGVFGEFKLNGKTLELKSSLETIKGKYNLNNKEVEALKTIQTQAKAIENMDIKNIDLNKNTDSRLHVSNWKVYFTNHDVNKFLFAAASIGPAALMAAIVSLSSMVAGPVGTVISAVLSVLGAASLSRLCYLVIQANTLGKGVYIGVTWNGPFPNYTDGLW